MGIQDAVRRLAENQVESVKINDVESDKLIYPSDRQYGHAVCTDETDRLEKLLFRFAAVIDKLEAERQAMKNLYQEVDNQKGTVGKTLVSLDTVIQNLPNHVNASVKASLERNSAKMDQTAIKVSDEMSSLTGKIDKVLNENFSASVEWIKSAATKTEVSCQQWTLSSQASANRMLKFCSNTAGDK